MIRIRIFCYIIIFMCSSLIFSGCFSKKSSQSSSMFKHHYITRDLPGDANTRYGIPALADLDNDGDLDYVFSTTLDRVYWFEFDAQNWIKHVVGEIPTYQLGGNSMDVDNDGWIDIVAGGYWFRNPQNPGSEPFTRYAYDKSFDTSVHDMVIVDIDNDGKLDVVVHGDREGCFWYAIPDNPRKDQNWTKTTITLDGLDQNYDMHGGFFPKGIDDLDNDGDMDVVMPGRWYENQKSGQKWINHPLPWGKIGPWGLSSRSWITDMDRDGDNDIVIVDCDQSDSRAAWLENNGKKIPLFKVHLLPTTASGVRGSFHSLAVIDFDLDGDVDIFTIEQEDDGIFPEKATPRAFIWENLDGKGGEFAERVVFDELLGGHDVLIGDVDADGDMDICSKVWKKWSGNANQGKVHADFFENLSK